MIFPDIESFIICCGYMGTFVLQGLLTKASQVNGGYEYNPTIAVLMAESLKLFAAIGIYSYSHSFHQLQVKVLQHKRLLRLYFVPAFLYCLYNNLAFINLANYDPTTYYLLLQFRVVVTGVVFQIIFHKRLSSQQWISLLILTFGCLIKEFKTREAHAATNITDSNLYMIHTVLIIVQIFCSCCAGVYNEKLLKNDGRDVDIMVQNVFMYTDSIICNLVFLFLKGEVQEVFQAKNLDGMWSLGFALVCCNNAAIGIITSLFLKKLNSVVKVFASAAELLLTAFLSWLIFGFPVDSHTFLSLILVIVASVIYSRYPIEELPKKAPTP